MARRLKNIVDNIIELVPVNSDTEDYRESLLGLKSLIEASPKDAEPHLMDTLREILYIHQPDPSTDWEWDIVYVFRGWRRPAEDIINELGF